jgi:hypothetical protein
MVEKVVKEENAKNKHSLSILSIFFFTSGNFINPSDPTK